MLIPIYIGLGRFGILGLVLEKTRKGDGGNANAEKERFLSFPREQTKQNAPTAAGLHFDCRRRGPPDVSDEAFNARGSVGDCSGPGVCSVSSIGQRRP